MENVRTVRVDTVIVGCGVSGLYCALKLPAHKSILIVTKDDAEKSDSFLAQGGICVLPDENDYDAFFEDTMRAGHYENNKESVDIMIRSSQKVISDLIDCGADFEKRDGKLVYTREGAHSRPRILFHEDETGKEITSKLLSKVRSLKNVTLTEHFTVTDVIEENGECIGVTGINETGEPVRIFADHTVLATGGIGGLFEHSTNFPHLTGDALAIALKHGIPLKDVDYIQIHPTTLYTGKKGRAFLISESVRGEGAVLLNAKGERFVNELQPRDVVTRAILAEMEKEGSKYVRLSLAPIPKEEILSHFPNIYKKCLEEGYDVTKEPIPVVPAQHYFMGGVAVDRNSATAMPRLYAVGETACNGVHGKNRLASNSLLESLVFAGRAAEAITADNTVYSIPNELSTPVFPLNGYEEEFKASVLNEIEKQKEKRKNG